ncbi:MAG TPA: DUF1415 domain-containing protein [Bacteroidia bacterium]
MEQETIIQHTQNWIKSVVVDLNFCPFAAKALLQKTIHYTVAENTDLQKSLEILAQELHVLDNDDEIETSFIIFPNSFSDFDEYLDLVEAAQQLIKLQDSEGIYQVATFHPGYCFEGSGENDPANYTNRSPYPMLHLLREESVEKALRAYKDPESIPVRNVNLAREKGLKYMQALRAACFG